MYVINVNNTVFSLNSFNYSMVYNAWLGIPTSFDMITSFRFNDSSVNSHHGHLLILYKNKNSLLTEMVLLNHAS